MKNKTKIRLISFSFIGVGVVLFIVGLTLGGRPGFYINKTGIHSAYGKGPSDFFIQEKTRLDEFTSINIDLRYADLKILPSDGYYIEYRLERSGSKPTLEVVNQELRFKESSGFLGIYFFLVEEFSQNYVTLYVPDDKYFTAVKLKSDDGKIDIGSIRAEMLEIKDSYGRVEIGSFQGEHLKVDMNDGTFLIKNLDAGAVSIFNSYGKCKFGTVKSKSLEAELNDGDFIMEKGEVEKLKINNDYGRVKLGLSPTLESYDFLLETEYGSIDIPENPEISAVGVDGKLFKSNNGAKNTVTVKCNDGNIVISQAE